MSFTFTEVKKWFVQRAKEGKVDIAIYYPRKGMILINFHCHDDKKNFMTMGLLMPGWRPTAAIQLFSGEVVSVPVVGNKEYSGVTGFLIAQKNLVNKAFEDSLSGICAEGEKRNACDCCRNFDQKIFDYVKTNMNKYWFKTKEEKS